MLEMTVKGLIENNDESLWLEYKSFWYWNENTQNKSKGWGEFLKDFSALFNTKSYSSESKYLIIGINEKTKTPQDYFIDEHHDTLKVFSDIKAFKTKLVSKLTQNFVCIPEFQGNKSPESAGSFFDVNEVNFKNSKLLVINISEAPFVLEITVPLQGNESFRKGLIPIRKVKNDGTPENCVANNEEANKIISEIENKIFDNFPEKEITIEKIVSIFVEKNFPNAKIVDPIKENNSSGVRFELFEITGPYIPTIKFIYIPFHSHQEKTVQFIGDRDLLKADNIFILTDSFNKKGGKIDKSRIRSMIEEKCEKTIKIEDFYLDDFALAKLYNDLIDQEIFHRGGFNINDFVKPYSDLSEEKTVDILLSEWCQKKGSPLMVVKGPGGIGKTTVIKFFLDAFYKTQQSSHKILFISSHDIINEITKNPKIDCIFDFYEILANINDIKLRFTKKLLELSVDHGDLLIVLDGIDEVIAKVGSRFNTKELIDSIYQGYSGTLEKTKIIITCRDYFWDSIESSYNIEVIPLKPFTRSLAIDYFKKHITSEARVRKAMDLADRFAIKKDENFYTPYVLDMIKDNLLSDHENPEINSNLLNKEILDDLIIFKSCEREIIKLDNATIDDQIEFFIKMSIDFNGILSEDHFKLIDAKLDGKNYFNLMDKFKSHGLCEYDDSSKLLRFKYDFFNEYFKAIEISRIFNTSSFMAADVNIRSIINQYLSYEGTFSYAILERLKNNVIDKVKEAVIECVCEQNDSLLGESERKYLSSLFMLLLTDIDNKNKENNTALLKSLYEYSENEIKHLSLYNLYASKKSKPIFDFRDLTFKFCWFENYDLFSSCNFSSRTRFLDSTFIAPLHVDGSSVSIARANIDFGSCDAIGLSNLFDEIQRNNIGKQDDLRSKLIRIIRLFWTGSSFRDKLSEDIRKKLKGNSLVLDRLLSIEVIQSKKESTPQKRSHLMYFINPKYSNLRKVMEENATCYEFDEIIKSISSN